MMVQEDSETCGYAASDPMLERDIRCHASVVFLVGRVCGIGSRDQHEPPRMCRSGENTEVGVDLIISHGCHRFVCPLNTP